MGVLPRPFARVLFGLRYRSVFAYFGVYERDVAVIFLGFFVHKREYSVRARHCHNDGIYLLRRLVYIPRKLFSHSEEGYHYRYTFGNVRERLTGDTHVFDFRRNEQSADNRRKNVQNIADIHNNRT